MDIPATVRRGLDRVVSPLVSAASRSYYSRYYYSNRWHPHYALLQDALDETVAYIKSAMSSAIIRRDELEVLRFAVRQARVDGLYLEFGVHSGRTISHIAGLAPHRTVHGFDSFEGLPEAWAGYTLGKGAFRQDGPPAVPDNVELHVGWFDETLAPFLDSSPGAAAFVHIDSDLYSSAKTVLDGLADRMVEGTVIVFNEYFNYPNWREHEYKAFQEFCETHGVEYEYLCWALYEVAVKITSIRGVA
jgi:hypothetical protein